MLQRYQLHFFSAVIPFVLLTENAILLLVISRSNASCSKGGDVVRENASFREIRDILWISTNPVSFLNIFKPYHIKDTQKFNAVRFRDKYGPQCILLCRIFLSPWWTVSCISDISTPVRSKIYYRIYFYLTDTIVRVVERFRNIPPVPHSISQSTWAKYQDSLQIKPTYVVS